MRIPGIPAVLLLLAPVALPGSSTDAIRKGLSAPSRGARAAAEADARKLARLDPGALEALWGGLDSRGRCGLVRALGSAGTEHAAMVALKHAADPDAAVFRALLDGLVAGGGKSLFTKLPDTVPPARVRAIEWLRLRWRVERQLVRLKSPVGSTGHYSGQFKHFKTLGRDVVEIFLYIIKNQGVPLPGEASSGPFQAIHPEMVRYDMQELRELVAHGMGEVASAQDKKTVERLTKLWAFYWSHPEEEYDFEHFSLAPNIAYSLFDLGVRSRPARPGHRAKTAPVDVYIFDLQRRASARYGFDAQRAMWSLGYAYIRIRQYKTGERYYEQILASRGIGVSRHVAAYNLACNFAMQAKFTANVKARDYFRKRATKYLRLAVQLNWWDWAWMEADGDLDFIRDTPEYKAILKQLKTKYPERKKGKVSKRLKDFLGGKKK